MGDVVRVFVVCLYEGFRLINVYLHDLLSNKIGRQEPMYVEACFNCAAII